VISAPMRPAMPLALLPNCPTRRTKQRQTPRSNANTGEMNHKRLLAEEKGRRQPATTRLNDTTNQTENAHGFAGCGLFAFQIVHVTKNEHFRPTLFHSRTSSIPLSGGSPRTSHQLPPP
jgi:hypothetical protein